MSIHKLTVGDGYTYLTRQVAAADATHIGRTSMGDFYAAKGESPGVWAGTGLSGLNGVDAGDHVSAEQMKALFGEGRHPNANTIGTAMIASGHSPAQALRASKLGRAFYGYDTTRPFRLELAGRFARHNLSRGLPRNARIAADVRTQIRADVGTEMFMDWHGRPPAKGRELSGFLASVSRPARAAVAGFDLTFSPVKSVSALWALASPQVATQIQEAQRCAVIDTLGWLERDAVFTRTGNRGERHVEVTGLIAAIFTHRDSRSGDPDLHTHVAISNKAQTLSMVWMALDGRTLFRAGVAASERYNTRIEAELIARLGVRFQARFPTDSSRHAIREVVGVDPALNAYWSSRTADIVVRRAALLAAFHLDRGHPPTAKELRHLSQLATLQTRAAKHSPRSEADQRATWRAQARQVLGGDVAVEAMIVAAASSHRPVTGQPVTGQWVGGAAAAVVAKVAASRYAWRGWHVRAEAERVARSDGVALADLDSAVDAVVAGALSPVHAVPMAEPEPVVDPAIARRRDGSSVYSVPGAARFTSRAVMNAEAYLVSAAHRTDRPADVLQVGLAGSAAKVTLNLAQPAPSTATPQTRPHLALTPAGPAKPGARFPKASPNPAKEAGRTP
jgi:conjugative relaxase-like TrwC/TraI family protein